MDFPAPVNVHGPVVGTCSWESIGPGHGLAGATSATTWPSANQARFMPIKIWTPYLIRSFWWANGTVTGNVDAGVYSLGGARLVSTGSIAQATNNVCQVATLGTPYLLTPGSYYLALATSSASSGLYMWDWSVDATRAVGVMQMATAFALPSAATFAAVTTSGKFPLMGFTRRTVV